MDVEASEDLLSTCQTDWIFQSSTKPDLLWRITRPALKVQMKSKWLQTGNPQPPPLSRARRDQQDSSNCNWILRDFLKTPPLEPGVGQSSPVFFSPEMWRQRQTHRDSVVEVLCGEAGDDISVCKWVRMMGIWECGDSASLVTNLSST